MATKEEIPVQPAGEIINHSPLVGVPVDPIHETVEVTKFDGRKEDELVYVQPTTLANAPGNFEDGLNPDYRPSPAPAKPAPEKKA